MGVESFYIVSKISNDKSFSAIMKSLLNSHYTVSKYTRVFGGLFKKKVMLDSEFVINNLIICSDNQDDNICFQACFSCYDKAIDIIVDVLITLRNDMLIDSISFGHDYFELSNKSRDEIYFIIFNMHKDRFCYFQNNYTTINIDVLPNEFYRYYTKYRKTLKKLQKRRNL